MLPGFSTSVSPESSEGEVWGTPERSGEVWGSLDRSGEVLASSGELWTGLGWSEELRTGLERSGEPAELWGGPGSSRSWAAHSNTSGFGDPKPEKPEKPKI